MSKRVYELAKELGMSSREVIQALGGLGVVAKSHSSTVDDSVAQKLKEAAAAGAIKLKPAATRKATAAKRPTRSTKDAKARPSAERAPVRTVPARPAPPRHTPPKQQQQQQQPQQAPSRQAPQGAPPRREPAQQQQPQQQQRRAEPAAASAPAASAAPAAAPQEAPAKPAGKPLQVHRGITVQDLAEKMGVAPASVVKKLFELGEMTTVTQSLTDEAVDLVAAELGYAAEVVSPEEDEASSFVDDVDEDPADLVERPPIITVMGHVDHGKTLLLDKIREADVVAGEAGGITQHIGAYQVHKDGRAITFIDTPGHEAFTQMRARGAKVTDIAVLVVAADDGVMPQTVEAISHARAAEVPIVVAVNKVDKEEADPQRVRQQLTEHNLIPEAWGGDTIFVDVSAKAMTNLDQLLEMLLLVADVQELKGNPKADARGVAIEAHLDKGRGPVSTVLVQRGTLRVGDAIVCGGAWCKVRAMLDEHGRAVDEAPPGTPVQVLGFSTVPSAGDDFRAVADERTARQIAQDRLQKQRAADLVSRKRVSLEDFISQAKEGEVTELNIVLKADVQGSLEAVDDSLSKLDLGEVRVRIIHRQVGAIIESDVTLAEASNAVVIGFNVRPDPKARDLAERESVEIKTYQIIYKLVEDIEAALKGMLKPDLVEDVTGRATVRQPFKVPKIGMVAGSYVEDGKVVRGAKARLLRDGVIIADTTVSSLRRFKDDVREVASGYECGIGLEGYQDIKVGDVIELYEIREVPRT